MLTDYHANGSYETLKQHVALKESEDYVWMVRSTDFENNFENDKRYIDKHAYDYLTKSQIVGGELIISKIGNAGKVYLMSEITRPCSLAMIFLIRLNAKLSSKYAYYFSRLQMVQVRLSLDFKMLRLKRLQKRMLETYLSLFVAKSNKLKLFQG